MRVTKTIRVIGDHNFGISLQDTEGTVYTWVTTTKKSPLLYAHRSENFRVSMNVFDTKKGHKVVKNVRILKEGQNV